jgi:universal stress protein F
LIARILVALDASSRAPGVLAAAAEIAVSFGASLTPFRALAIPPDFPPSAHLAAGDPLPEYLRGEALRALRVLVDTLAGGATVSEPIVQIGQPWRVILGTADELDVDLIVLGSHGFYGLDRVIGTTAAKVANLARRNVLVVHDRIEPPPSSGAILAGGS